MKKGYIVLGLIAWAPLWVLSLSAGEAKHSYIGAAKCKMCHLKQYKAWGETKHAKAFAALKEAEAKDAKCVKCHVTGYGKGGYAVGGSKDPDLANVQCEVCHGPGSDYKTAAVMKDKEKSKAAGLIVPDEKVCVGCHNKESQNFKEFNFEKMKDKVHPVAKG